MTLKPAPTHVQPDFFPELLPDKPISPGGEARTRYGAVVQEAVCVILGLTEIPNSGTHDIVFDAALKQRNTYVEIKSLREKNKLPIYDFRRRKDRAAGVPLFYAIAVHGCKGAATMGGLWQQMAESLRTIFVLPLDEIDRLAEAEELRQIKSVQTVSGKRNGYQRAGYCEGYRNVPWAAISSAAGEDPVFITSRVRGLRFRTEVFFHPEIEPWL